MMGGGLFKHHEFTWNKFELRPSTFSVIKAVGHLLLFSFLSLLLFPLHISWTETILWIQHPSPFYPDNGIQAP
jgi:hypothetical protein